MSSPVNQSVPITSQQDSFSTRTSTWKGREVGCMSNWIRRNADIIGLMAGITLSIILVVGTIVLTAFLESNYPPLPCCCHRVIYYY